VHFSANKFAGIKRILYICNINLNFMVMKKVILLLVMVMSTIFSFAQDETRIKNLKEQKEILSLTTRAPTWRRRQYEFSAQIRAMRR